MDNEEFEQRLLKLAFETDIRITVASIAYYFGLPSRDVSTKLDALIDSGLLELDSDRDGNLFYKLHQDAGSAQAKRIATLTTAGKKAPSTPAEPQQHVTASSIPTSAPHPNSIPTNTIPTNTLAAGTTMPGSVEPHRVSAADPVSYKTRSASPVSTNAIGSHSAQLYPEAGLSTVGRSVAPPERRSSTRVRAHRPDATVGRCGTSSFVISENATCDQRLTANHHSSPRTSSCDEETARPMAMAAPANATQRYLREQQEEAMSHPVPQDPSRNEIATRGEDHHPFFALMLSIFLPGSGQFYNGEIGKGLVMMLLSFISWWALLGWVIQLWSVIDAVTVAARIQSEQKSRKDAVENPEETRRAISARPF